MKDLPKQQFAKEKDGLSVFDQYCTRRDCHFIQTCDEMLIFYLADMLTDEKRS